MKRIALGWTAVAALAVLLSGVSLSSDATAEDTDKDATIAALQTRVASLTTPTATAPARVQPTVDATPQALADNLTLLYYWFFDPKNDYEGPKVAGELRSDANQPLMSPTLKFTLLDADGNILGVVHGIAEWRVIEPGQVMPFRGDFYPADPKRVGDWQQTEVAVCPDWGLSYGVETYGRAGLELRNVQEHTKEIGKLVVVGDVYNGSDQPAESVYVKAAVYDAQGRYTGEIWTRIEAPIPAGKSARFRVDEGVSQFGGQDALTYAGPNFTYKLGVSRDSAFSFSC